MKPKVLFTIADNQNLKYVETLEKSLRKFHTEEELPLVVVGEDQIKQTKDPMFFYRATPIVARDLLREYETVVKIDADSVVTGKLDEAWEGEWDVAVVANSNPVEKQRTGPITVWNIDPLAYLNCGFVAMKSQKFVDHWLGLCASPHFNNYQFKEQDLLNIMVFYMNENMGGPYKFKNLDVGDSLWGLSHKGYWLEFTKREEVYADKDNPNIPRKDTFLYLPPTKDGYYPTEREIKVIHWAGGNQPNKINFYTQFKPEIASYLKKLTHD